VRIALTHAYCWPEVRRGGERILSELAYTLAGRGHGVTVFSAAWHSGTVVERGVRFRRMRRRHADAGRHEQDFSRRLLAPLALGHFDAVHSLGPRDALASVAAAVVHPRRRTVYSNLGLPWREWWDQQPDAWAHDRVVRHVDVYGCISRHSLQLLATDYGREGVLTPPGVNFDEFSPVDEREPAPTLLYAGALDEPRKGVPTLLHALPLIAEREPDVRLWLSGTGDVEPVLAAAPGAATDRTTVLPLGEPWELRQAYGRAWATALPSMYDSFGLTLLESLACGTPIVASTHAAPQELVQPGIGALCEPEDTASVANACVAALALARDADVSARCRAAAQPYDWRRAIVPALEALYR
jgi:phosphatidyl-myo-inositol alpha-mannosyltransferase